jgi:hypothetical protein
LDAGDWTPGTEAWGPYEIKVTGTNAAGSVSEIFVIDAVQGYVTANLRGNWDAQFATLTGPTSGTNSVWKDLTTNAFDATLGSNASWIGNATPTNPYAVSLDGTSNGYVNFDSTAPLNGQTQLMFTSWVNAAAPTTGDLVVLGNSADATGNGITLRQSKSQSGKVELVLGQSYQDAVLALAPLGYWRLGESSGTTAYDISGHGLNGTYTSVTLGAAGAIPGDADPAASFDGSSSSLNLGNSVLLMGTGSHTISVWVNLPSGSNGGNVFAKNSDESGGGWGMTISAASSSWSASVVTLAPFSNPTTNGGTLIAGTWTNLVAVFDNTGGVLSTYQDGVFVSSNPTGSTLRAQNDSFIGNFYPSAYFGGLIDEAAIFNSALTPAQITALYTAGTGTNGSICYSQSALSSYVYNFLGGIFSAGELSLFVNGRQECQVPASVSKFSNPSTGLYAGATATGTKPWNGSVADLKIYGTSNGSPVGTAANVFTNFGATADRFRATPEGNIVTTGLLLNLDAANAVRGLVYPGTGCTITSWFDLSSLAQNGTLSNFSGCNMFQGWNGSNTVTDPYRLVFSAGQSNYVLLPSNLYPSTDYTAEVWFNTTSDGVLLGSQTAIPSAGQTSFNPVLYVDTGGILRGGFYSYSGSPVISTYTSTPVNDGNWHQAVVTGTTSNHTQTLYLDGAFIGIYNYGLWDTSPTYLLGVSATPGWTNAPVAEFYYTGAIAKFAAYGSPLMQTQIRQNCNALVSRFSGAVCN